MYVIRKECLLESCIVKGEIEAEVDESTVSHTDVEMDSEAMAARL